MDRRPARARARGLGATSEASDGADSAARPVRRVAGQRPGRSDRTSPGPARLLGATEPPITSRVAGAGHTRDDAPIVETPPRQTPILETPQVGGAPPRRFRTVVVAACAAFVLIAAALVTTYLLTRHSTTSARTSAPQAAPTVSAARQAERWIVVNLDRDDPMTADPTVAAHLEAAGFSNARASGSQSLRRNSFVVETHAIRGIATGWASLPVAIFGRGPDRVEVRMLVSGSAASLSRRLAADSRDRTAAGEALLRNPRLTCDGDACASLQYGRLDMRAAAVLAVAAARTDVRVMGIVTNQPEADAKRPPRRLILRLADATALPATLRALPTAYAPAGVSTLPGKGTQLVWSVGLAPMSAFN